MPHLEIKNLVVGYPKDAKNWVQILRGVELNLRQGESLALVGESGCGKTTLIQSIIRASKPPLMIQEGEALWDGRDLLKLSRAELMEVRWKDISFVVQGALDALHPLATVWTQMSWILKSHREKVQEKRMVDVLDLVGLPSRVLKRYPHELSGGMRQRVVLAMALLLKPRLMILDEPTTALDVITQGEILQRLLELKKELGWSVILVTHDLPVALEFCDRIGVMYGGQIVEQGFKEDIMARSRHPYTRGLLNSFPKPSSSIDGKKPFLKGIPGTPATVGHLPQGCSFHTRCARAQPICASREPSEAGQDFRTWRCFYPFQEDRSLLEELSLPVTESLSQRTHPRSTDSTDNL